MNVSVIAARAFARSRFGCACFIDRDLGFSSATFPKFFRSRAEHRNEVGTLHAGAPRSLLFTDSPPGLNSAHLRRAILSLHRAPDVSFRRAHVAGSFGT